MGFCTLTAMILTIFLGAKAFPGEGAAEGSTVTDNPAYGEDK
jgi:hypothetical protein